MSSLSDSLAVPPSAPSNSETLLACFINGLADLAYLKDAEGRFLAINAAAARFLGKSSSEIVGRDDFAVFAPEQARRHIEQDRAVFASGSSMTFEDEVLNSEGRTVVLQTVKSLCRDEAGNVVGLACISRDIGERKQLERALQRREDELAQAQRVAGIGTWRWDRDTDTVTWSDEIYRIFGLPHSHTPENYAALLNPDRPASQQQLVIAFGRAVRFGEPYSIDMVVPRADGTYRWVIAHGEVESWANGQVASLRGTVLDITERKLREDQLALSENRYRSLVHASAKIVWVADADGMHVSNSPGWQEFTGQSHGQIPDPGWSEAIHPADRAEAIRAWEASVGSGAPYLSEFRVRRHDGLYRDMLVRAVPVLDASGQIVEWVGTHTDITEQKSAQEQLRRANQRLENVLDSITDGLCVLDHDLRYIYYNENGARQAGLRVADIIGKQLGDIYSENKGNAIGRNYRRALETGETLHFEEFYGEPLNKWFECNCYPSVDGLTVYFRDITERKRTEQALRESESRYRSLFESHLLGICHPDRFGAFREGNDELLRITGYTREELEAGLVRWDTMTPPEYAALDAAHIAEAAARGSCTPYEKEYIRKDGSRVPILCGYALLEGSEDEYIGFVFDLSRQRAAEAALREREQRFRLLAETLPELVWLNDPAGSITYLNQPFLDYCGIPNTDGWAFDWKLMIHPEEIDHVRRTWQHSLLTGDPYLIELRMRRHDGAFRYFLSRALPMRNDAGEIEQWVGSCTDVHDQKLAEEALRRSEKLAATGRLAASIAHEINNPLASVTNTLYLALQDPNLAAGTRAYLKLAEQELARVSHITTQTLRFHRQSKAAAYADLSETMQSVLMLFGPRFRSRQIEIESECEPGASVCCFEDELRQVFANLVSNSLDATADQGRLRIRVRNLTVDDEPGVRVTVADTGCGIPREIRQRIFEPFFSTKDTTGIGLGLWVSDGVIRKHSARLSLRSRTGPEDHGTVFSLFFPREGVDLSAKASGIQ
jgi:PAS domain S-box-containing protein